MEPMTLQLSYVLMGIVLNLMSLRHFRMTGNFYTPTRPVSGLAIMVVYGMAVFLPVLVGPWPFRVAMIVLIAILLFAGVLKHLVAPDPKQYASSRLRWLAVVINCYGIVVSVFALTVSFMGR